MTLQTSQWNPASGSMVVSSLLRADRAFVETKHGQVDARVTQPDHTKFDDNQYRLGLLKPIRPDLFKYVPPSEWHTATLTEQDLPTLMAPDQSGGHEFVNFTMLYPDIAQQVTRMGRVGLCDAKRYKAKGQPETWPPPILWSHAQQGPYTVLDGNHRLLSRLMHKPNEPFAIQVLVGLSPEPCIFHRPDRPVHRMPPWEYTDGLLEPQTPSMEM